MKNKIGVLLVILLLFPCLIYSQDKTNNGLPKAVEFSVGLNKPFFLGMYFKEGIDLKSVIGFTIGYSYTGRMGKLPYKIGGGLDNFRCNVKDDYGGWYEKLEIDRNQTNLYLEFNPFVKKNNYFQLSLGTVFGLKIIDTGHSKMLKGWTTYFGGVRSGIDEINFNTSALFNFGLKCNLMFEIPIKEKISIAPRYSLTYYITPLIINTSSDIRGIKQNFDLVLKLII